MTGSLCEKYLQYLALCFHGHVTYPFTATAIRYFVLLRESAMRAKSSFSSSNPLARFVLSIFYYSSSSSSIPREILYTISEIDRILQWTRIIPTALNPLTQREIKQFRKICLWHWANFEDLWKWQNSVLTRTIFESHPGSHIKLFSSWMCWKIVCYYFANW